MNKEILKLLKLLRVALPMLLKFLPSSRSRRSPLRHLIKRKWTEKRREKKRRPGETGRKNLIGSRTLDMEIEIETLESKMEGETAGKKRSTTTGSGGSRSTTSKDSKRIIRRAAPTSREREGNID